MLEFFRVFSSLNLPFHAVNFWTWYCFISWCLFIAFIMQVLVFAKPSNTNALILKEFSPSILEKNITCLTRPDYNKALNQIAKRLKVHASDVKNIIIWDNHSSTHHLDVNHATFTTKNGERLVQEHVAHDHWYLKISNMFIHFHFHMFKLLGDIGW